MINKKVARRYTLALWEIADQQGSVDKLKSDFLDIKKTIEGSHELKIFLSTPIINSVKKEKTLEAMFGSNIDKITLLFIKLLCQKGREKFLYDISIDFLNLLNEKQGIVIAKVKTAVEIGDKEKSSLASKLESYSGKKIQPEFSVDPQIKGGFVAQVDDTIIDASIKRQLELLYEQFREGSFKSN